MKLEELKLKIFADGADLGQMQKDYQLGFIKGFTTNPTLMRKAGVTNYMEFARKAIEQFPELPISFEVFSDDFVVMYQEAKILASLGENVYVKIPITNSEGESSISLISKLSSEGVKLNITAVFTLQQVLQAAESLQDGFESIISIFAGRIMDTGIDAVPIMQKAGEICRGKKGIELLWASCREVYNIFQAEEAGCDIITVTSDILRKTPVIGKDLEEFSLETVRMFARDAEKCSYKL